MLITYIPQSHPLLYCGFTFIWFNGTSLNSFPLFFSMSILFAHLFEFLKLSSWPFMESKQKAWLQLWTQTQRVQCWLSRVAISCLSLIAAMMISLTWKFLSLDTRPGKSSKSFSKMMRKLVQGFMKVIWEVLKVS